MTLVLTLTNGNGAAGSSKTFDRRGGAIGRNPDNDWVLPDPNRIAPVIAVVPVAPVTAS